MTWSGLTDASKAVAAALGALGVLGYVTGYLVLRARAHALGIAPPFELVDEVYAFAGFRFLIALLVLTIFAAPVALALVSLAVWVSARLADRFRAWLAWIALAGLALMTVVLLSQVLAVRDLLFVVHGDAGGGPGAMPAVLGFLDPAHPGYAVTALGLEVLALVLVALTVGWLVRLAPARRSMGAGLAVVLALQLFLLPTLHGALRADRVVPVLAAVPGEAGNLDGPAMIVDQTKSVATLFGLDRNGQAAVVTIAAEDLHGLAQRRPVSLFERLPTPARPEASVVQADPAPGQAEVVGDGGAADIGARPIEADGAGGADSAITEEGFLAAVAERIGRLMENLGALSDNGGLAGRIVSVSLSPDGSQAAAADLGPAGVALSWPVAGVDGSVYALRDGALVQVEANAVRVLNAGLRWRKLIGVLPTGEIAGIVEGADGPAGALFSLQGTPGTVPLSRTAATVLLAETHRTATGEVLEVNRSERGGRGLDVYLIRDGQRSNLSRCGDLRCVQPSLGPSRDRVLFVRVEPDRP